MRSLLRRRDTTAAADPPELVPILSAGKHRGPAQGACFMEMASYLAGERWSDHPSCTHPLLAGLARMVNDYLGDEERSRLVVLVPSVVGLTSTDPAMDVVIALRCAATALPIAPAEAQTVLASGLMACERLLADLQGRAPGSLTERGREALESVPAVALRATRGQVPQASVRSFRTDIAPRVVAWSVDSIAQACIPDPADLLASLLAAAIEDCSALVDRAASPATSPAEVLSESRPQTAAAH